MTNMNRNAIGLALQESTLAYYQHNDQVQLTVTPEWNVAGDIWRTEHLARKLIASSEEPFKLKYLKSRGCHIIDTTKLGKLLLLAFNLDISKLRMHYPAHAFNPYVDAFIRLGEERHLFGMLPAYSDAETTRQFDALNGFVDALRKLGRSASFKKTLGDFERSSNKNYRELCKLIDAHFEETGRLLILRIDLGYIKLDGWPMNKAEPVSYEEVRAHRLAVVKFLKTKLPEDSYVDFAMKLEYGLDKKWHYHLLVLLDGSVVREDVTIARLIGEHWKNVITGGKGLYWNCNANKETYKCCGIGMVSHYDTYAREGLKKAALYMTKTDYFVKLLVPGDDRTFWKGTMPTPKKDVKPMKKGRPRTRTSVSASLGVDRPGAAPAV